jgi:hypothetical protein
MLTNLTNHCETKLSLRVAIASGKVSASTLWEEIMENFYTDVIKKDRRFKSTAPIKDSALLKPITRSKIRQIIANAAAQAIKLMVYETYRSQERQELLLEQKATQSLKIF